MSTFEDDFPHLNPIQRKMLLRTLVELLPEKHPNTDKIAFRRGEDGVPQDFQYLYEYAEGFNNAIDDMRRVLGDYLVGEKHEAD